MQNQTDNTTEQVVTLSVPTMFWDDHYNRTDDETGAPVKRGAKKTTVEFGTADALHNFMSDAAYYADSWEGGEWRRDDDPAMHSLGRSAMTTKQFIKKNHPGLVETYNASDWSGRNLRY